MTSDKISKVLERQLKTLGQKIRIDILKKLEACEQSIPFSMLQKEVLGTNPSSVNFSYHLKKLEKIDFICSTDEGYSITSLGKRSFPSILSMEQVLNDQNKTIMIRTSKYSKEPFNIEKIKDYLIKEGEMEKFLARKIAQEVKKRLSKANIEYLTAPLIREYVNAVLLENDLEEVRHKLTRLGTPPFEALKLFESSNIPPDKFIKILGSEASEQFLLLNLLPNHLADMYLSGEIVLLHLNQWALRPLSFYLNTDSIMQIIESKDPVKLILEFLDILNQLKPYFSEDIVLGNFNQSFFSTFNSLKNEKILYVNEILSSEILNFNSYFGDNRSHLTLNFHYNKPEDLNNLYLSQFQIDKLFLNQLNINKQPNKKLIKPLILFDYTRIIESELGDYILNELISHNSNYNLIFYNHNSSNLINSIIVNIENSNENGFPKNKIILDKILINMHLIALEANQNDDAFYDLIQEKVKAVFEFFDYKESLVKKKLNSLNHWNELVSQIFNKNKESWIEDAVKSISFYGLNESIKLHCGIELDRISTSEKFALSALSLINKLIKERNDERNSNINLSQPHNDNYLMDTYNNDIRYNSKKQERYTSNLIRADSNLPLIKKISLFKRFEEIITGGTRFNCPIDPNKMSLEEALRIIVPTNLQAFSLYPYSFNNSAKSAFRK